MAYMMENTEKSIMGIYPQILGLSDELAMGKKPSYAYDFRYT